MAASLRGGRAEAQRVIGPGLGPVRRYSAATHDPDRSPFSPGYDSDVNLPRVLVTNDDGAAAEGIQRLAECLGDVAEPWIIAPDTDRSGSSHALTMSTPLRWRAWDRGPAGRTFGVSGTPGDCVYFGLSHLLNDRSPALVVAGINRGYNLADDVTYSGTVAAAMESVLLGVPAIAISAESFREDCLTVSCLIARRLVGLCLASPELLPSGTFLNVNVPHGAETQDLSITSLGRRAYSRQVLFGTDPRGKPYFWVGGDPQAHEVTAGTDCVETLDRRRVSITPMQVDLTAAKLLATWSSRLNP